jgi:hypothetical protein
MILMPGALELWSSLYGMTDKIPLGTFVGSIHELSFLFILVVCEL